MIKEGQSDPDQTGTEASDKPWGSDKPTGLFPAGPVESRALLTSPGTSRC